MPLIATRGAASAQGFGEFAQATAANYIEDVFSTYLYTGTGAALTITNNIDLSTKGGLVWTKGRITGYSHNLVDTARGTGSGLASQSTGAQNAITASKITSFNTAGYSMSAGGDVNVSAETFVSWTFRKQPKFFDVVTWSPNGSGDATVAHSLNSVPGAVFIKKVSGTSDWQVYHRSLATNNGLYLNTTDGAQNFGTWISVSSTQLSMSGYSAGTYVTYLFAHDAGGFGLTGTDNVISCGSFNYNTDPQTVTIGYEPQWLMVKRSDGVGDWIMFDNMRGFTANAGGGIGRRLLANTSGAETANDGLYYGGATGFNLNLPAYGNYIYIAIRRGPMKVPTTGTSVFQPVTYTGNGTSQSVTTGITGDLTYIKYRTDAGAATFFTDRLRGSSKILESNSTVAEDTSAQHLTSFNQLGFSVGNNGNVNASGGTFISETFKRAPSFFDEVCYTGNNVSGRTITHNLAAVPQLMIVKSRTSSTRDWIVYDATNGATNYMNLNNNSASGSGSFWVSTTPTSTVFTVSNSASVNDPAQNYVAYLFATCAGVSKVGSYTGTATTKQIDCGFTAGARFVLIKRTDSTGDWYVWDSARGIVAGNDSYLLLNSTAAEVTNTDYIDTYSAGFEISSTAPAAINANGGSFIFFAVA